MEYCKHCEKELGSFGKFEIADGFLCNQCKKSIRSYTKIGYREMGSLSYSQLLNYNEDNSNQFGKEKRVWPIIAAITSLVLLIAILIFVLINALNKERPVKSNVKNETTETETQQSVDIPSNNISEVDNITVTENSQQVDTAPIPKQEELPQETYEAATDEVSGETEYEPYGATVYITKTGKKYHSKPNCRGLSNATSIYSTSLSDAVNRGYDACEICY